MHIVLFTNVQKKTYTQHSTEQHRTAQNSTAQYNNLF